jgi:GH24 family phage-related lysozyme (muramidase)
MNSFAKQLNRRTFTASLIFSAPLIATARAQSSNGSVEQALKEFRDNPELASESYGVREFAENFPSLRFERAPSKVPPSGLKISPISKELIIAFEVSSKAAYNSKYYMPIWPGGLSGVTIGIGYDLGYVNREEFGNDWSAYLDHGTIIELAKTCGKTSSSASDAVKGVESVRVSWDDAVNEFEFELQKYVTLTQRSLPNFSSLSENCRGSLVSLVYNRGPSFDADGPRYAEMRNIKDHMEARAFSKIPDEIRAMVRIWPTVNGLKRRRLAEADLFASGL